MKIRLEGTQHECEDAAKKLEEVFDVTSISAPYKNRDGKTVRIYVTIESK